MGQFGYDEVLEKINHASVFGSLPGAEISRQILRELGHPEHGIPFVHVAGTNGKGSVCAFLTQILMESGMKVGTFTSPHLIDFEERITVNKVQIGREDVARLGNRLLSLPISVRPTMFDYCMAMAILYFKEQACDIMVMETGLGGRLDSTNAIGVPEVTVITKIGYDHMEVLGDSLAKIAAEKAGIIKPGTYLVMEGQEPEALHILYDVIDRTANLEYSVVDETDIEWVKKRPLGLLGTHQWENAAAAVKAARYLLGKYRAEWNEEKIGGRIACGLKNTYWQGRMEILSSAPFLLVDGAHNGHGARALYDSLCYLYPGKSFHFIMAVMADKDYRQMVQCLLPLATGFSTVATDSARALQADALTEFISSLHIPAKSYKNIQDIVTDILQTTTTSDKFVAFGSLYFIGALKSVWEKQHEEYL